MNDERWERLSGRVGLLGAGGQAREIRSYLPQADAVFYAVSPEYLDSSHALVDITSPSAEDLESPVVGAVGPPALRRSLVDAWPGTRFTTVVSTKAYVDESCDVGEGSVIAPGAVLTVDVVIGRHCLVNVGATLSHDVRLGDFVTVGPGAHLAGNVVLGDGAFVGIGAAISNNVSIAEGVVVAAGAVVMTDVPTPNAVVMGIPAQVKNIREDWLDAL